MKNIDKAIILNFKIIREQIGVIVSGCLVMFGTIAFVVTIPMAFILIIGLMFTLMKVYKKLFVDTIFGEDVSMYNVLPISVNETVISKIFVATITTFATNILILFSIFIGFGLFGSNGAIIYVRMILETLGFAYETGIASVIIVLLSYLCAAAFISSIIFFIHMRNRIHGGKLGVATLINTIILFLTEGYLILQLKMLSIGEYETALNLVFVFFFIAGSLPAIKYIKGKLSSY